MNKVYTLSEAIEKFVESGDCMAIGGFTTSRKPLAAISEIIRQGKKDFIGEGGPAGSDWDMLIGAGCVKAYINCYTANPRFSNVCRRYRAAIEEGTILFEDYSQDAAGMMFHGAALGIPYIPTKYMLGSSIETEWGISEEIRKTIDKLPDKKFVIQENPFNPEEKMLLLPSSQLDVTIIHAQVASPDGTCRLIGNPFHDVDLAFGSRKTIITCEELVPNDEIRRHPELNTIPGVVVDAVVHLPFGAHPAQVYGYYDYDIEFYTEYDKAGKTGESYKEFLDEWVYGCKDHREYLDKLGATRLIDLKVVPGFGYHADEDTIIEEGQS